MHTYYIYKITNLINNKIYIGRTTQTIKKRWSVHLAYAKHTYKQNGCSYICNAMKKYGVNNFTISVVDTTNNFEKLVFLESFYINYYNTTNPKYGYNLLVENKNGDGLEFLSESTKILISTTNRLSRKRPTGVLYDKFRNKWLARFVYLRNKMSKRFTSEIEAKETIDKLVLYKFGEKYYFYYPEKLQTYKQCDLKSFYEDFYKTRIIKSKYRGVMAVKGGWFNVRIHDNKTNKRLYIGCYKSEEEAAIIFDKVYIYLYNSINKINCPDLVNDYYKSDGEKIYNIYSNNLKHIQRKKTKTSIYRGVNKRSSYTWEMTCTINKQKFRLVFDTELDAAKAYDEHVLKYNLSKDKLNFPMINK